MAEAGEPPVRVMVVDDSVVVRGLLSRWIGEAPGFEIVATAPDGRAALDLVRHAAPDIVLLDLDMPRLDGVAALPLLLRERPGASVLVLSTLTQRNAEISLRCLALGAVDCVPKPGSLRDLSLSAEFRAELLAKLEGLAARHRRGADRTNITAIRATRPTHRRAPEAAVRPRALVIGASTGGPRAVIALLRSARRVAGQVPILLVQHMPPIFTAVLAQQISVETGLPAREGRDGERLERGRIYVAPGGHHMGVRIDEGGAPSIRIDDGPARRHCRPAVDVLFTDAARIYGGGTLAVVLTGMGQDGLDGAAAIAKAHGTVLVQDEASSVVWGMPGSIARAGLAQAVLPLAELGDAVVSRLASPERRFLSAAAGAGP